MLEELRCKAPSTKKEGETCNRYLGMVGKYSVGTWRCTCKHETKVFRMAVDDSLEDLHEYAQGIKALASQAD